MRIGLIAAAIAAALAFSAAALAEGVKRPRGVVELFTSQGCTSCPPADEILAELAQAGEVVALAYHVDYWDYLGWRDTLASPENTRRQHDYAGAFNIRSVYTPQAVINGRRHVNGAKRAKIDRTIASLDASGEGMAVDVSIRREGDSVVIETGAAPAADEKTHVVLVFFDPAQPVEIDRGENGGRSFTYWNAVTGFQTMGMWNGKAERFEIPASEIARKGKGGCAVLLQSVRSGVPGPILGAAVIEGLGAVPR